MNCTQCQSDNNKDARFCHNCGNKLKDEQTPLLWTGVRKRICSNCFFPSYSTSVFCMRCGNKLPEDTKALRSYVSQEKTFSMLLVQDCIITDNARIEIDTINKGKAGYSFMDTLIKSQFAPEEEILKYLALKLNIPYVPISSFTDPDKSLIKLIPEGIARRQNLCIVGTEQGMPIIAMSNPISVAALTELRSILPQESFTVICKENDIKKKLDSHYHKKVMPVKISSAAQIDAYDIDSDAVKPTENEHGSRSGITVIKNTTVKKHHRSSNKLFKLFVLCLIIGGVSAALYFRGRETVNLPAHLKSARQFYAAENYAEAIKEFRFYLIHKTDDIEVRFTFAKALYALKDYGNALEQFDYVKNNRPDSAEAYYLAGICSFNYELYNQAIDDLKRTLQLDPKKTDVYKYIGLSNIKLGDHKSAIRYFEKTLKIEPKNKSVSEWLVQAYLNSKQYAKTISISRKLLRKNPDNAEILSSIGYAKAVTGNFKHGIMHYKQSGLFVNESVEGFLKNAFSLMNDSNYDDAISEYIKVLSIKENDSEAYNNLAIIYRKKGYKKSSQACFKKAKRILKIR